MSKVSPTFCVAPWVHAHVAANGGRRLCCVAKYPQTDLGMSTWSEFKNSDYLKDIRKQMLIGQSIPDCKSCDQNNKNENYRDELNRLYEKEISSIIKATSLDGSSSYPIRFLDYRKKTCNLKCQTCSPYSSSAYFSFLKQKNFEIVDELFHQEMQEASVYKSFDSQLEKQFDQEVENFIENENLNRVYFAGGEPLLDPNHFFALKKLLNKKSDIQLFYNTNLMITEKKCLEWLNIINDFTSEITVFISIDGRGEIGKYLRKGIDLDTFDRNLNILKSNKKSHINLKLDMTLSSLSAFNLCEMADYALLNEIELISKLMIGGERYFPLLRIQKLPQQIRMKIISDWQKKFNSLNHRDREFLQSTHHLIESILSDAVYEEVTAEDLRRLRNLESLFELQDEFFKILNQNSIGSLWSDQLKKIR